VDDDAPKLHPHPVFDVAEPQMSGGERAALRGVLSQLQPALALEIGTAEGATLGLIASYAGEVHSFDLFEPVLPAGDLPNVTLHTGDSHELLPRLLGELAGAGRNVDFALVDGDHTPEGVRRDLEDLLASPAVTNTTILIHDTSNPTVRSGVDAVDWEGCAKVVHVQLDWISGYIFSEPHFRHELWGGLGCVIVDAAARDPQRSPVEDRYVPIAPLLERARRAAFEDDDPAALLAAAQQSAREQLARGDAEHEMRVAAQDRVAELERLLREERARGLKATAAAAVRRRLRR
jgi:hypothetical protein